MNELNDLSKTGKNLASSVKQASHRARAYKLEDDGASELASRKRSFKNKKKHPKFELENLYRTVNHLQKLMSGFDASGDNSDHYQRMIDVKLKRIEKLEKELESREPSSFERPAVNVIAPMTRRVAREDRRRSKKERALEKKESLDAKKHIQEVRKRLNERDLE